MSVMMLPLIFIGMLFGLVPVVGLIVLQVYLSKLEKDWPGLVLPGLFLGSSVIAVLGLTFVALSDPSILIRLLFLLVIFNIPTLILFLIYKSVHKKQVPTKELDRMTIQDLN